MKRRKVKNVKKKDDSLSIIMIIIDFLINIGRIFY